MITRRNFVGGIAGLSVGIAPALAAKSGDQSSTKPHVERDEDDVTPAEDLMREHGALNRMLLIYESARERLAHEQPFPRTVIVRTGALIRNFIEDYHEKLEEDYLFPRFRKAGKLVDLVDTLARQHEAGRKLTGDITEIAGSESSFAGRRNELKMNLTAFIRMYRPHEAREGTVLFPALRTIISERDYKELGEQFEEREHKLFGKDGFEGVVEQIADLEKEIGIYDLSQFTP
jgi:hemerythrin-like domain-containing protein